MAFSPDEPLKRFLETVFAPWLVPAQLNYLETQMALNAQELKDRMNAATNDLAGDVRGLKEDLEAALIERGVAIEAAVQEALAGFDTVASNLEAVASETPNDPLQEEPPAEPAQ